jgi:hypothetical protein
MTQWLLMGGAIGLLAAVWRYFLLFGKWLTGLLVCRAEFSGVAMEALLLYVTCEANPLNVHVVLDC